MLINRISLWSLWCGKMNDKVNRPSGWWICKNFNNFVKARGKKRQIMKNFSCALLCVLCFLFYYKLNHIKLGHLFVAIAADIMKSLLNIRIFVRRTKNLQQFLAAKIYDKQKSQCITTSGCTIRLLFQNDLKYLVKKFQKNLFLFWVWLCSRKKRRVE